LYHQTIRDVYPKVWFNANEVRIKGGMVDFGQWNAVGYDGLPQPLVRIGNDVRSIEQS
jgi:hypothetical protein